MLKDFTYMEATWCTTLIARKKICLNSRNNFNGTGKLQKSKLVSLQTKLSVLIDKYISESADCMYMKHGSTEKVTGIRTNAGLAKVVSFCMSAIIIIIMHFYTAIGRNFRGDGRTGHDVVQSITAHVQETDCDAITDFRYHPLSNHWRQCYIDGRVHSLQHCKVCYSVFTL